MSQIKVTTMCSLFLSEAINLFSTMAKDNVVIEMRNGQLCFISDNLGTLQDYLDLWNQHQPVPLKGFRYRAAQDEFSEPTIECIVNSDLPIPDVKVIQRAKPTSGVKTYAANFFIEMSADELAGALSTMKGDSIYIDIYEDIVCFETPPFHEQVNAEICKELLLTKRGIEVIDFQGFRDKKSKPMVRILIKSGETVNFSI